MGPLISPTDNRLSKGCGEIDEMKDFEEYLVMKFPLTIQTLRFTAKITATSAVFDVEEELTLDDVLLPEDDDGEKVVDGIADETAPKHFADRPVEKPLTERRTLETRNTSRLTSRRKLQGSTLLPP